VTPSSAASWDRVKTDPSSALECVLVFMQTRCASLAAPGRERPRRTEDDAQSPDFVLTIRYPSEPSRPESAVDSSLQAFCRGAVPSISAHDHELIRSCVYLSAALFDGLDFSTLAPPGWADLYGDHRSLVGTCERTHLGFELHLRQSECAGVTCTLGLRGVRILCGRFGKQSHKPQGWRGSGSRRGRGAGIEPTRLPNTGRRRPSPY